MAMDIKFFKNLYNEDIIYHYTKASTAIDFILYNNQLKFKEYKESNDPIESAHARRGTIYTGAEVGKHLKIEDVNDTNELHDRISSLEKNFYQVCFCKNHMGEIFSSENCICDFEGHEEIFGFTKLRMWDQYADNFAGVCLALSKGKILSANEKKLNLIAGDVTYYKFRELSSMKMGDIQGNHLVNVGKEVYLNQIEERVKQSFFYKHLDYKGENEFRIGTLYNEKKCIVDWHKGKLVFGKTMMLDITNCIEAIFMSSYANDKQKDVLLDYANKLKIPIIEMDWKHDSFEPRDYKKSMELLEAFK